MRGTDASQSDPRTLNNNVLFARVEYGEGQVDDTTLNLRTRPFKSYDSAGVVASEEYDFKGNLRRAARTLADDYKKLYDWSVDAVLPSWETYRSSSRFDALNRPTELTTPHTVTMPPSVYRSTFNEANLLEKVDVNLRGEAVPTPFVTNIDYDAKGQRVFIEYGNSTKTNYDYDPLTFRLTHLETLRATEHLQDLSYTYDPSGNITHIQDDAQQEIYFNNHLVEPHND